MTAGYRNARLHLRASSSLEAIPVVPTLDPERTPWLILIYRMNVSTSVGLRGEKIAFPSGNIHFS